MRKPQRIIKVSRIIVVISYNPIAAKWTTGFNPMDIDFCNCHSKKTVCFKDKINYFRLVIKNHLIKEKIWPL